MKIILKGERPISWNMFYQGGHWKPRSDKALEAHALVKYTLFSMGITKPRIFQKRVNVRVTGFFSKQPLDSDNIPAKLYVDALKGILITDDSPRFVADVTTRSELDPENPRIEIEITEVEEGNQELTIFRIPSLTKKDTYHYLKLETKSLRACGCSCPGFLFRNQPCKHMLAFNQTYQLLHGEELMQNDN